MSGETKSLKITTERKVKILKQLDKVLYPWLSAILSYFYKEPNNPYYADDFKILMNCVQNLTEKYIFKNNSPSEEWQAIGASALFIVTKVFAIEEEDESEILTIPDLVKMCDGACSKEQILKLEMQILKMNNYIICEHITKISTPKQRLRKSARRVITRSYRKKSK